MEITLGLQALLKKGYGLQSILRDSFSHMIDRTVIEREEEINLCPSDTKSTKSESNSLQTHASSVSNGPNCKQTNGDAVVPLNVNEEDMIQKYYKELRNSLRNCFSNKQPPVTFKDIAGNTYAKQILKEAFILPSLAPDYFTGKLKPWNKILLYGPPGVGKTMMARAVAKEMKATVLWVSLADITSKFIGESEKLLRMLFELAREKSPSIIIIDEMDSIGRKRNGNESETERRIKTEFLKQMDEINAENDDVYVLATTNMPWELDIAALRRFERRILLPIPDMKAREEIFRLHIGEHPHDLKEDDFKYLANLTEGYSGSDISNVVKDALIKPARMLQETSCFKVIPQANGDGNSEEEKYEEYFTPCHEDEVGAIKMSLTDICKNQLILRKVNLTDFKESIKNCKPTVESSLLSLYNKFLLKYGHIEQKNDLWKEDKTYQTYYL